MNGSDRDDAQPTFADVREAAARLRGIVRRTPALPVHFHPTSTAAEWLKCENLQLTGSFKIRGAMNALLSLDEATRARGVATHSSGNHGAALAYAAFEQRVPSHIVVPTTISPYKRAAIDAYSSQVHECAPSVVAREAALAAVVARTGADVVHAYDDARVIAGQGTAALELLEQVPDLDVLLVPVSGGGLLSGCAIAAHGVNSRIEVYGVEPELAADAQRSLASGTRVDSLATTNQTIADGLRVSLSKRTFRICRKHVVDVLVVSEREIVESMRFCWDAARLIVEPSSAVVTAALHRYVDRFAGKRVGMILTGGNVSLDGLPWRA